MCMCLYTPIHTHTHTHARYLPPRIHSTTDSPPSPLDNSFRSEHANKLFKMIMIKLVGFRTRDIARDKRLKLGKRIHAYTHIMENRMLTILKFSSTIVIKRTASRMAKLMTRASELNALHTIEHVELDNQLTHTNSLDTKSVAESMYKQETSEKRKAKHSEQVDKMNQKFTQSLVCTSTAPIEFR